MKLRAIVLDDDDAINDLVSNILRERGYEVYASSEPFLSQVYMGSGCPCSVGHTCTDIIITDNNQYKYVWLEIPRATEKNGL